MIHIIDYNAGNLTSVQRALTYLGVESAITQNPDAIAGAGRIIFPGVGRARPAMRTLHAHGLDTALKQAFARGAPLLGICIGCQVALSRSDEDDTLCLNLIKGTCRRFEAGPALKVPHMGWNAIEIVRPHPVLAGIESGDEVYFVHSYYPEPTDERRVYAVCDYGVTFPAAIGFKNLFATQFHLEKSGETGLRMLRNFTRWDGQEPC